MTDREPNALIPRPGTEVAAPGQRTPRVIAEMVRDVLARATDVHLSQARFRIGDYALREPDYRQILRWAEAAGKAPEEVLAVLNQWQIPNTWSNEDPTVFRLQDGAIVELDWDFESLSLVPETWEPGLRIRILEFRGPWPDAFTPLRPILPQLTKLFCSDIGLASLDLSSVPALTVLDC